MVTRLALIGIGKIARDQHIPALTADPRFVIAATASRSGAGIEGVPAFRDLGALLGSGLAVDAVSLCTPPDGRAAIASQAIAAGLHVMLEKPPGTGPAEVEQLAQEARTAGVTLFASWHSRAAGGVEPARSWLAGRRIDRVAIIWKEDIRRWHPGQEWILGPGGFGVFDPGINALSILTAILPERVALEHARLVIPEGRESPIAADLEMRSAGIPITADFDFRQTGPQSWDILIETDAGNLILAEGGTVLTIPGTDAAHFPNREYVGLYDHFARLIATQAQDVDTSPLRIVCDALSVGDRIRTESFLF